MQTLSTVDICSTKLGGKKKKSLKLQSEALRVWGTEDMLCALHSSFPLFNSPVSYGTVFIFMISHRFQEDSCLNQARMDRARLKRADLLPWLCHYAQRWFSGLTCLLGGKKKKDSYCYLPSVFYTSHRGCVKHFTNMRKYWAMRWHPYPCNG